MHDDDSSQALTRRRFLRLSVTGAALSTLPSATAIAGDAGARPVITSGVQTGDVEIDRAVVWCRTDRPARLRVRYGTTDALAGARERVSAPTSAEADFTARLDLTGLPPGQRIVYEARFEGRGGELSEPVRGAFRTPARTPAPVRIVWGGDVCGQGWGIDEGHGGMRTFASMRRHRAGPVHPLRRRDLRRRADPGDAAPRRRFDVAQPRRGRRRRGRPDTRPVPRPLPLQPPRHAPPRLQRRGADGRAMGRPRGAEQLVPDRGARRRRQRRALHREAGRGAGGARPSRRSSTTRRSGPIAAIHDRSIASSAAGRWPRCSCSTAAATADRTPPTSRPSPARRRHCWRRRSAPGSRRRWRAPTATWKIVACDQPIGVVVPDGPLQEGFANADPRTLGREHEVAALLSALKRHRVRNVLFVTADVHYAAAHRYDPARATYTDFDPFWEFVAGPLHAGTARSRRARRDVRPRGRLHVGGAEAQWLAGRRAAVLRARGDRSGDARRDRHAARSRRQDPLYEGD